MTYNVNNHNQLNGKPATAEAPNPEVKPQKTARRKFSAKRKLSILAELDNLEHGQIGSYLRKNGLYSATVANWRKQRDQNALDALSPKKRGAKPKSPETRRLAQLELEKAKIQKQLEKAELIIDVQKKLCALFGVDSMTGEQLT